MSKKTTSTTTRTLPAGLPPLPQGYSYLGKTKQFSVNTGLFRGIACDPTCHDNWGRDMSYNGLDERLHYAAPADSEIARLNGLAPEPERKVEADAWIPTERAPWCVIFWNADAGEWQLACTHLLPTRKQARAIATATSSLGYRTRCVRPWIPLKDCPLTPRKKGGCK